MKPKILLSIFLIFVQKISFSQSCVNSSSRFLIQAGESQIAIRDNEVLADSSIVIAGNIWINNQSENYMFISKLDKHNNILFSKKIVGFTGFARKIIECHNGDILIAAITYPDNIEIPWLFRFSSSGDLLWQKQLETTGFSFSQSGSILAVYESIEGYIYLGMTADRITDPVNENFSGYYYIYKLNAFGNSIWRTTLVQNENYTNYINAITQKNGVVSFITQQYTNNTCSATDSKSVSLFRLNDDGSFINTKTYCLNFSGSGCLGSWTSNRHSAAFIDDGGIAISGQVYFCDERRIFTLKTDEDFLTPDCHSYKYTVPYGISSGAVFINKYSQTSLYSRGYDGSNFLYAALNTDGTIVRERKLQLSSGNSNAIGAASFAYRKPNQFLVFSNLTQDNNDVLQVMEFKGDNNGTSDCTGKDTTFITSMPHTVIPISFTLDTIRTENFNPVNSNFIIEDFTFERIEVCSNVSICDSLKISGNDSVCLNNPTQNFIATRNPGCNKVPQWRIDPSAIVSITEVNDTTIQIKFKKEWEGYLYAYSNACGNLLDSFYIKVFSSPLTINIGRDTTFCTTVNLDAGANFINYKWQDNSTNRFYNVSVPGKYYVSVTDLCGNVHTDTINYFWKTNTISLGNDTCISQYPFIISASNNFKSYAWQNGSSGRQFSATAPGLYYINATNFCNEVFTDSIYIYKTIRPFSLGADSFLCPGNIITLKVPSGYQQYRWQNGSTGTTFEAAIENKYFVTVLDFCGKEFSDTINIIQLDKKINLGPDLSICKKEKIELSVKGNFISYSWNPAYNIDNASSKSVTINPEKSTEYFVMAKTVEGCEAHDTIMIFVKDCPQNFFIPTAFTPNDDTKNDIFKPVFTAPVEKYELNIYNRWGQRIFYTTDKSKGWDGKLSGIKQDANLFLWTCTYKFYDHPIVFQKGSFLLLR